MKYKTLLPSQCQLEFQQNFKQNKTLQKGKKKELEVLTNKKWEKQQTQGELTHSRWNERKYSIFPWNRDKHCSQHLWLPAKLPSFSSIYAQLSVLPAPPFQHKTSFSLNYLFPQITLLFLNFKEWRIMNHEYFTSSVKWNFFTSFLSLFQHLEHELYGKNIQGPAELEFARWNEWIPGGKLLTHEQAQNILKWRVTNAHTHMAFYFQLSNRRRVSSILSLGEGVS